MVKELLPIKREPDLHATLVIFLARHGIPEELTSN
jgi:hypothetical protein